VVTSETTRAEIAMLVHALDGRLVSRIVAGVAETMERMGQPCHVLTTVAVAGSQSIPARLTLLGSVRPTVRVLPALARALRRIRPAALVAHVSGPNLTVTLARTLRAVRIPRLVLVEHNEYSSFPWRYRALRLMATRLLYPRADLVVGVSPGVVDSLRAVVPRVASKLEVIPAPLLYGREELERLASAPLDDPWFGPARERPVVVTVGNVSPRKDHETLIRAAAVLACDGLPVNVVVVGRTDDRDLLARLKELATGLGVGDAVRFVGYQSNPLKFVARADVFALTSRNEGFGMVLVEAMAVGTPVVSTDCPAGPRWICEDGRAGLLVPVGNPEALAAAIRRLIENRALRARLQAYGLRRAGDFSLERVARRYLEAAGVTP
jgi:glycosyltransferase involved in cell wall biosynthesis